MTNSMAHARARRNPADGRAPASRAAATIGVIFLIVGVLGFLPGITTNFGALSFVGHESMAKLFGVFQVSVLHNLVHLAFGVAGLALSRTAPGARTFLVGGGAVYLVLWLYGLMVYHRTGPANFIPVNGPDNWLHLALGIGMIALGLATTRSVARR
ncbi:DUF4383 domain-containing protein [Micromonospora sp. DR5-3]|uniref:DUF4383 domain-containing protein n=1 Tax=unclassified Micromonospora TaxID=2617518 RepID=UPI0011D80B71|nr:MULTISPECIES: DUF4383 domain-containing protein [unclassified Micromonospora]MCW3818070.1 DUF4383 domain-containing protein [Micromonospora sp. DR5-3]TYC22322.1 DUF4383 domain-containing protein [Micromonospora sp. MP36]